MNCWRRGMMVSALVVVVSTASWAVEDESDKQPGSVQTTKVVISNAELKPGEGIAMLLRLLDDGGVELLRLAATARPPAHELFAPKVGMATATVPVGWREELVVTVHDQRGGLLATHAFPVRRVEFYDQLVRGQRGALTGAATVAPVSEMLVRVSYPRKANFMFLSRVYVELSADQAKQGPPAKSTSPTGLPVFERRTEVAGRKRVVRHELLGAVPLRNKRRRVRLELPSDLPRPSGPVEIDLGELKFILGEIKKYEQLQGWQVKWDSYGESGGDEPADEPADEPTCGDGSAEWYGDGSGLTGRFNVVITGDGFTEQDLDTCCNPAPGGVACGDPAVCSVCLSGAGACCDYLDRACRVKEVLTKPWIHPVTGQSEDTPFSRFSGKINIFRIDRPSAESGVDHCPDNCKHDSCITCTANTNCANCLSSNLPPNAKTTAYEVAGNAYGFGQCTNFTSDVTLLHDAACEYLDPAEVDLYVVLVNCNRFGAKVDFDGRVLYMATWEQNEDCAYLFPLGFDSTVLHELGHAVAHLGEEYIAGAYPCETTEISLCQPNCASDFPNVATKAQVDTNNVPWKPLARTVDLVEGQLYVEAHSNQNTDCESTTNDRLGAFWGATFIEPDPGQNGPQCGNSPYNACLDVAFQACDKRGGDFYRPMAECKMREVYDPFCRVCDCELWNALADATETPRDQRPDCNPPQPPPPPPNVMRSD